MNSNDWAEFELNAGVLRDEVDSAEEYFYALIGVMATLPPEGVGRAIKKLWSVDDVARLREELGRGPAGGT